MWELEIEKVRRLNPNRGRSAKNCPASISSRLFLGVYFIPLLAGIGRTLAHYNYYSDAQQWKTGQSTSLSLRFLAWVFHALFPCPSPPLHPYATFKQISYPACPISTLNMSSPLQRGRNCWHLQAIASHLYYPMSTMISYHSDSQCLYVVVKVALDPNCEQLEAGWPPERKETKGRTTALVEILMGEDYGQSRKRKLSLSILQ